MVVLLFFATVAGVVEVAPAAAQQVVQAAVGALDSLGLLDVEAAERSLAAGQGPAGGEALNCSVTTSSLSGSCSSASSDLGPVSASPHPDGNCSIETHVYEPDSPQPACLATPLTWQSVTQPGARELMALAYDKADRYTVAFGGWNGTTYFSDTWEFVKGKWIPLDPPVSPSPRDGAAMSYDEKDGYVLLFGGRGPSGLLGDSWKFLGGQWTLLTVGNAPSPRTEAGMADEIADGYVVLFGGWNGKTTLSDTWEFASGTWTEVYPHPAGGKTTGGSPAGGADPSQGQNTSLVPAGRDDAGFTYDARDGVILMFGGNNSTGGRSHFLNDTWFFADDVWTPLSEGIAPPARAQAVFAYDGALGESVLFGGLGDNGATQLSDTWILRGATWTEVSSPESPSPRSAAGATYDGNDSWVVVFSGNEGGLPASVPDTWTFNGTWEWDTNTPVEAWPNPSARYAASFAFDLADDATVLFGGSNGFGTNGETWVFSDQQWTQLYPSPSPAARSFASLVYDPELGSLVLFGGLGANGQALGDTWTFTGYHWTQLSPSSAPSPRFGAAMVYDSNDSEVVLFGGVSATGTYLGDTWSFQNGAWTALSVAGGPSARGFMQATYDGSDGYALFYGGINASGILGDTWEFLGGTWTQFATSGTVPPARWGAVFQYDPENGVVLLYGGCQQDVNPVLRTCNNIADDAWRFAKGKWGGVSTLQSYGYPTPAVEAYSGITAFALTTPTPTEIVVIQSGLVSTPTVQLTNWRWLYSGVFTPWSPPVYPSSREGAYAAYDWVDDKIVMFGGYGPLPGGGYGYLNDTWEWDTYEWYPVFGATHPPSARAFGALAYDTTGDEIVYFGGDGASGYLGDTWAFLGGPATGDWHKITTQVAPPARANESMAWDNATQQMVLFGGQGNNSVVFGDTWVYVGNHVKDGGFYGNWTQEAPATSPTPRASASMIFDVSSIFDPPSSKTVGELLLFGGWNPDTGVAYNDTWTWTGSTWVLIPTTVAPSPRYGAMLNNDPQDRPGGPDNSSVYASAVLFGGESANGTYLGDTWTFWNDTWRLDTSAGTPSASPLAYAMIADDEDDGNVEMFGGTNGAGLVGSGFWTFF